MELMPDLGTALEALGTDARLVFLQHLRGGTSTAYLADWLTRAEYPTTQDALDDYVRREYQGVGTTLDEN